MGKITNKQTKTEFDYLQETSSEVQFFLMHDYDNNSKLDGLELLQSLSHHKHSKDEGTTTALAEYILGDLSNDDGNGTENARKQ